MRIDWYYYRASCDGCAHSRELLAKKNADIVETIDARTTRFDRAAALALARTALHVVATRGRSLVRYDMKKSPPTDDDLARSLLGPTGNLKAPTIRIGRKLIVGFNADVYKSELG